MNAVAKGEALAVKGNHEELMIHAYEKTESVGVFFWAENGGYSKTLSGVIKRQVNAQSIFF